MNESEKTYFTVYETRHNGEMAEIITPDQIKGFTENEDNHDIYVCYVDESISWENLISVEFEEGSGEWDLRPWLENRVSARTVNNELIITTYSSKK
jgi:hypothetical protein